MRLQSRLVVVTFKQKGFINLINQTFKMLHIFSGFDKMIGRKLKLLLIQKWYPPIALEKTQIDITQAQIVQR